MARPRKDQAAIDDEFQLDGEETPESGETPETVEQNRDDETDDLGLGDLAPAVATVEHSPAPDTMAVKSDIERFDTKDDASGNLPDGGGVADRDGDGETKSEPSGAESGGTADLIDAEQDREYGHTDAILTDADVDEAVAKATAETPVLTPPVDHTVEGVGERHYFRSHNE